MQTNMEIRPGESGTNVLSGIRGILAQGDGRVVSSRFSREGWLAKAAAVLLGLSLSLLSGCATKDAQGKAPRPGKGIKEYREITARATSAVLDALRALDRVSVQTKVCPPKVAAAFSQEVERLQVGSIRVRARAQAIQARGDAYFEAWSRNLSPIDGPPFQQVAEHLPEMQESFTKLKVASQQTGEAFRPFLSGLRKLRAELEKDPAAIEAPPTKELIRITRDQGRQVVKSLGLIKDELQVLNSLVVTAKPASKL